MLNIPFMTISLTGVCLICTSLTFASLQKHLLAPPSVEVTEDSDDPKSTYDEFLTLHRDEAKRRKSKSPDRNPDSEKPKPRKFSFFSRSKDEETNSTDERPGLGS